MWLLLAAAPTFAQNQATLDLLVKKNIITLDEAAALAKSSALPATLAGPKDPNVQSLIIAGLFASQFDWLSTRDKAAGAANPPAEMQFLFRRAYFGILVDLGNGWGGDMIFDFAAGAKPPASYQGGGGNAVQNNFEKIIVTKKIEDWNGQLAAGYQKVNFTLEEYTSSAIVKPIERSLVARYFDEYQTSTAPAPNEETNRRLGFASHHNGIFWDGRFGGTGFFYGTALTTGIQNSTGYTPVGGLNRLAGWVNAGYNGTFGGDLTGKAGLNLGYSRDGNSNGSQSNSMGGFNPYFSLVYANTFQLDAEWLEARVAHGRINGGVASTATPYGFYLTPSYKINDQWELVARFSYLYTDGRGTNISDVVLNASNVNGVNTLFNQAQSLYLGLNWNALGNNIKLLFGYEWDVFRDRQAGGLAGVISASNLTGPRAEVSGVRARVQMLF